ncbi:Protein of unknown function DUF2581 [Actinobacteria bacterium OK074]|nr:Protein of unknown function DUF2581 [Actinobacteria bacterium OK074]
MPLSFLTVDHAFDEAVVDRALPYDDRDHWRRPYRPGPWRVGAAALALLLASYGLVAAVVSALTGSMTAAVACLCGSLVVILSALRLLRMGVWVSAHGLRRVGFFRTTTAPWAQVVSVRTLQQPVRWLGLPRTVQGQALVLVRRGGGGGTASAALLTTHGADFLARGEAFERAADTVEAWAAESLRG